MVCDQQPHATEQAFNQHYEDDRIEQQQIMQDRPFYLSPMRDEDEFDTDIEEEMMHHSNPLDTEWRDQLREGDELDAQNVFGIWCPARILHIIDQEVQVHYLNMSDVWTRWLPIDSGQLAPPNVANDSTPLRYSQPIKVRRNHIAPWRQAFVMKVQISEVFVRYPDRQSVYDEWVPFHPECIAPSREHIQRTRQFQARYQQNMHEQLKHSSNLRPRQVIEKGQNPRFRQYQEALATQNLSIYAVEGDGNCLFRSVSHQIYGNDSYHAIVRQACMDYMESEKEYFEPYVVGDMTAFLRYVEHKRRDGVWGDDPELQALCELYDRPAEVFAYDPVVGARKLRTFHENSATLARTRPVMRLSYYGGGHYDSIVQISGAFHQENTSHEQPGEWERRRIQLLNRINSRERDNAGRAPPLGTQMEMAMEVSEREHVDETQVEHVLMISRQEFDSMLSNLDDTLQASLATALEGEQNAVKAATDESERDIIQEELIVTAKTTSEEEQLKKAMEESLATCNTFNTNDDELALQRAMEESMTSAEKNAVQSEEEELRRILELSAQEYKRSSDFYQQDYKFDELSEGVEDENEQELQRAIAASLQQ